MKYDNQLAGVKEKLASSQNILIALPPQATVGELAAALALYLALEQSNKKVAIVTESTIRVGHSHLFGVDKIQDKLPPTDNGDYVVVLGGVVNPDGTIPSLEKMDYFPTGSDLNLVFRVLPGQKFEPTHVTPKREGGGFDLIFTIGATTLDTLGSLYTSTPDLFSKAYLVNIDKRGGNAYFGATNIVDPAASSVSEMMSSLIQSLQLTFDGDIATNILSGIFESTANLQAPDVTAETFEAVAAAMRVGGRKPIIVATPGSIPTTVPEPATPVMEPGQPPAFMQPKEEPKASESYTVPPVTGLPHEQEPQPVPYQTSENKPTSSPEETPSGEQATTQTPEADWLTPKIFKGSVG